MSLLSQSCAEASRILSEAQDSTPTLRARIGLRLHLAICRHCRRYQRQLLLMRSVFGAYPEHLPEARLPDDIRQQLVRKLEVSRRAE
jgi:hypothetical protein